MSLTWLSSDRLSFISPHHPAKRPIRRSIRRKHRVERQFPHFTNAIRLLESTSVAANLFVSSRGQCHHCLVQVLTFDQHVVRVKGRNREDRNPRVRQRLHQRRQHASQRKRKRPFELQRHPSAF